MKKLILWPWFFLTATFLLTFLPQAQAAPPTDTDNYRQILQNTNPDHPAASIPALKDFISRHPDFTLRGTRRLVALYVFDGKSKEAKQYLRELPKTRLPEKIIGWQALKEFGYLPAETERKKLVDEIKQAARHWNRVTIDRLILLDFLKNNKVKEPAKIKQLPMGPEANLYVKIDNAVAKLNLKGLHKLLVLYPKNSDYLALLGEIFPNTNGKIKEQLTEMIYLARAARKAGNLETALYVESQIIAVKVNYLGESYLNKEEYNSVIKESKQYAFFSTTIDLISTLALHSLFRSNYEKALHFAEIAENLSRRYHLKLLAGVYAGYMGICYSSLSQFDKALDSYETACTTLKELNPEWYEIWKAKLAYCYTTIGDTETAETLYQQILETESEKGKSLQTQYTYRDLTELYIKRGELDKAEFYLKKVNTKAFPGLIKKNNAISGRLAYAKGNYRAAVNYLSDCLADKAPLDASTQLDAMIELASAYQALGQNRNAEQAYQKASAYFEELAATRFSNISYRKGFFSQHYKLYLRYISFLVNTLHKPGKAWLLVRDLESGPFQYFSDIILKHLQSSLSFPDPKLPEYFFNNTRKNMALKKQMVRIEDAKSNGKQTFLAGPGGVFQTNGRLYTQVSTNGDIQQLSVKKGHWAGISRKKVILDGKLIPLPKMPDRVLTGVQFTKNSLLVGSSRGLYRYFRNTWQRITTEPIMEMSLSENSIIVLIPHRGLLSLKLDPKIETIPSQTLYPDIHEIRDAVSFSKVSKTQFIIFTPDKILILGKSGIIGKIPFSFGVIRETTTLGRGRWLISTVLNHHFVLENAGLYRINMGKSRLLAGCSTGNTSFFSTDHTILVENRRSLIQRSLFRKSRQESPGPVEKIGANRIALGFRGEGIAVYNMENGSFIGFFPVKLEQFKVNGSILAVLTSSGHVKTWTGRLPDHLTPLKTFYPSSPIQVMLQLKNGPVLASFSGGGLAQWERGHPPRFFGQKQGIPSGKTITAMIKHKGKLLLGSTGEIVPFDYRRTGPEISVPGNVVSFAHYKKDLVIGTTRGAFLLKKSALTPVFGNHTTGQIFDLDSTGNILAAATENGVFVKTETGIFRIATPEQARFVAVTENGLLMVSKRNIFIFNNIHLPVLIQFGTGKYIIRLQNRPVFLQKNRNSPLFLDTGDANMIPVSVIPTGRIDLLSTAYTGIHAMLIPPFGGQAPYSGTPVLLESGKPVSSKSLKPGIHHLTLSGSSPFHPEKMTVTLNLIKTLSFAWWITAILGIIIILLLATRYFKWRKGRYIAHYRILEQLGEGGMGTVYHAKDIRNNKTVALKLLNRQVDPVMVERFKREWQIMDRIKHPNIIEVFDRGEHMEQFFIAMEMLHGHTLDEILEKSGPIPEQAVAVIAIAVAGALQVIHRQMIVHRDLKPSNIMYIRHSEKITEKIKPDEIKLMDFGVSKELLKEGLTTDGSLVGTLLYVAPESLSSLTVDQRSDIYALGVTMYELLTGTAPFTDENQISIYYKILNSPPPPFPDTIPISRRMEEIVIKCLAKDPENRYPDAQALIEALTPLVSRET